MSISFSNVCLYPYSYSLTIRRSSGKYTTFSSLKKQLFSFAKHNKFRVGDYGYHITGKLSNFAHIHAYIESPYWVPFRYKQNGPFNFCLSLIKDHTQFQRYIHTQDHACPYKLEQLILENYYMHNYYGGSL